MSHKSGDRARADKQRTKRRLRRSELRPLRALSQPARKPENETANNNTPSATNTR